MLTDNHKTANGRSHFFLQRDYAEGQDFLDKVVTGDETYTISKEIEIKSGVEMKSSPNTGSTVNPSLYPTEVTQMSDSQLKASVIGWPSDQVTAIFDKGIGKLVPQYDKYLN